MSHLANTPLTHQPAQTTINLLIWICSLLLQLALFATLFLRRIARRFPCLTTLIGFYLIRSTILFLIFGHVPPATYGSLYNTLSTLGALFEIFVAAEVTIHLLREQNESTLRRILIPLALLCTAAACTALTIQLVPAHAPVPVDRTQIFFAYFMISLFVWTLLTRTTSAPLRSITRGFALYAIISIIASTGRTYASAHNLPDLYRTCSYATAGAYLTVVILWLFTLKPAIKRPSQQPASL